MYVLDDSLLRAADNGTQSSVNPRRALVSPSDSGAVVVVALSPVLRGLPAHYLLLLTPRRDASKARIESGVVRRPSREIATPLANTHHICLTLPNFNTSAATDVQ